MTTPFSYFTDDDLDDFVSMQDTNYVSMRDWQRRAKIAFVKSAYKLILESATGSGKSFAAISLIKHIIKIDPKVRTLIVVPKNVILETGWYKELVDAGMPIQDIGVYYGNIKEYSKITLTNMQNLKKIPLELFDFLILDEVHNYATDNLLPIISTPCKYKLGLTATIKRQDYRHYDLLKIFDYNVFKYDPQEALDDGVLNPFKFINIGITLNEKSREEYELLSQQYTQVLRAGGGYNKIMMTTGPLKSRMLSLMIERKKLVNNHSDKFDIVNTLVQKHKEDKVIVFNQFNDQTNKMYWSLLDTEIESRVLHSDIKDKNAKDRILIDFRANKFNILLTTKVLDEGYNLPKLDTAIITAGENSDKQTIQRMGRALRKKEKPSKIYQIY